MIALLNRYLLVFVEAVLVQLANVFPQILPVEACTCAVAIYPFSLINVTSDELFEEIYVSAEEIVRRT